MKKLQFSLKRFRGLVYLFFILSILFTFAWASCIYYFSYAFSSFSKGASLLGVYLENYYLVRVLQKSDKPLSKKIEGFIVFYDLLRFRDRDYDEIVRVWRDFGMTDDEIFVVVLGTKVFRIIPGLMDKIRASAEQIYENINSFSFTLDEEIERLINSIRDFIQAFVDTMRMTILYFVVFLGLVVVYWVAGFGFYIIRYMERLKVIVDSVSQSVISFVEGGKVEKIDIVDERSEGFWRLQEVTNSVIEKGESLKHVISEVENSLVSILETIETSYYTIRETSESLKNLLSGLYELDKEKFEGDIANLSRTFSVLQKYTQDIKMMFEEYRSKVENIFEPVETLYEIISAASKDYKKINEDILSYLRESNIFVKFISESLKKQDEQLGKVLEALRRIYVSLKNVGINSIVEFSKVSSESLFQISKKIIDTSKNLKDVVLETSMFVEEVRNNILQNFDKLESFYLVVDEISKDMVRIQGTIESLLSDKEKVIENIRYNYGVISSLHKLLDEVEKVSQNMNSVYYTLESNVRDLFSLIDLREKIKDILEIFDVISDSLSGVKSAFSKMLEEIRKYK